MTYFLVFLIYDFTTKNENTIKPFCCYNNYVY